MSPLTKLPKEVVEEYRRMFSSLREGDTDFEYILFGYTIALHAMKHICDKQLNNLHDAIFSGMIII